MMPLFLSLSFLLFFFFIWQSICRRQDCEKKYRYRLVVGLLCNGVPSRKTENSDLDSLFLLSFGVGLMMDVHSENSSDFSAPTLGHDLGITLSFKRPC